MKNLKRVLSLVMALALCLGLASTAFATSYDDYPDADEVTYEEAMDVLVALGIIEGIDGQLDPGGTLTREQAAKMIAYICLGGSDAESLTTSSAPFSDVAADRWSAGYIAYCVSTGIINGRSATIFDPEAEVTGYEFAKMLLCAIGYGANSEFTGSYWEVNTASYGALVGLFEDSVDDSYNDAMTREEAMLYAFNILTGPMTVSYSSTLGTYYSGTSLLTSIDEDDEYLYTLGYQVFGLYQSDSSTDDFGRVGYTWKTSKGSITDAYYEDADLIYVGNVDSATLYSDLGKEYAGYATLYVDGEEMDEFPIARGDTSDDLGSYSAQIYVYADSDTYEVTIVVINTYLGEVTGVDDGEVSVTVYDSGEGDSLYYGVNVGGSYDYETDDFDEDDMVLVTVAGDEIHSMELADTVIGVMDALASSYLVIDGETYYKSDTYGGLAESEDNKDYDSEYTFYLDQNGYVLGSTLYEEADADYSSYLYVTGSEISVNKLTGTSAQIAVQYLDGTTDVLDLYVTESNDTYYYVHNGEKTRLTSDGDNTTADGEAVYELKDGGFFRYSVNSSGYVSLKEVSTSSQAAAGWNARKISVSSSTRALSIGGKTGGEGDNAYHDATSGETPDDTLYLNSSTVLHVIDEDGDVTTVTGYSNIKGYKETSKLPILVFYTGSVVNDIFVFDGTWTDDGTYALYIGKYTTSSDTYYRFYQDGATVAYTADTEPEDLSTKSLYELEVSSGNIEECTAVMTYSEAEEVIRSRTDYFTTESGYHYYDDDVVVYDYTNGNAEATLSGGDWVVYAEEDGMVAAIYIVSDPATTGDADTSGDLEISNVFIGDGAGKVNFTASEEDETVYIVVDMFTSGSGYQTIEELTAETTGNNQTAGGGYETGRYRISFYADADYEELIGTFYVTSAYTTTP